MVFSLFSHIHTQKSIFYRSVDRKIPFLTPKSVAKRVFGRRLGGRFRMVAQNFRPMKKMAKKLPFMSKNGKNTPEMPRFFAKSGFFLCKIHKKAVFCARIVGQERCGFCDGFTPALCGRKPLSFVQNHQNRPPLRWLTASSCVGYNGRSVRFDPISARHALRRESMSAARFRLTPERPGGGCISLRTIRHTKIGQFNHRPIRCQTDVAERKTIWNNL